MEQPPITETVRAIARLRRVEEMAAPEVRGDVAAARELLERMAGPTVRQATAAKLFGVSRAALVAWLDRGEIASVLTPQGRREIPLAEVLNLLDDVDSAHASKSARPLSYVIRQRRRQAEQAVDLDRLLPRRTGRGHRVAERQSLAYHRLVAERLDGQMLHRARRRVQQWRIDARLHPHWLDEWERALSQPVAQVAARIAADDRDGRQLRQSSPFAGMLNEQERRQLQRAVEAREA